MTRPQHRRVNAQIFPAYRWRRPPRDRTLPVTRGESQQALGVPLTTAVVRSEYPPSSCCLCHRNRHVIGGLADIHHSVEVRYSRPDRSAPLPRRWRDAHSGGSPQRQIMRNASSGFMQPPFAAFIASIMVIWSVKTAFAGDFAGRRGCPAPRTQHRLDPPRRFRRFHAPFPAASL